MGALLGMGSNSEVAYERVEAFQSYFDVLCEQADVVRTHIFQAALAVCLPEPVAHLRVRGWLSNSKGERALLDIRAEGQEMENSAIVESYFIVTRVVQTDAANSCSESRADIQIPAATVSAGCTTASVDGLPAGAQVEFEVYAENALGRSAPVSIRLMVPQLGQNRSPTADGYSNTQDSEAELEQRRLELEQWWSRKRDEAEREDAERQRQISEVREQREALEREKEELVMERLRSGASSPAYCSPSNRSPQIQSPSNSPRGSKGSDDVRVEVAMLTQAAADAVGQAASEAARAQWDDLRVRQEELTRQTEELQRQREENRREADRAAAEVQAEREAAMKRSEEEQRHAREELQRERQELEAVVAAQRESVAAREADYLTRAEALEEQQETLNRQRAEVESNRAAEEEERRKQLDELKRQQESLEEKKVQAERQHSEEEEQRKSKAEELERQQEELHRKANHLSKTEEALGRERMELRRSRASLAVAQAHVVSMLDKAQGGETKLHSLSDDNTTGEAEQLELVTSGCDEIDEEEEEETDGVPNSADADEQVWDMDWTSPVLPASHKAQSDSLHQSTSVEFNSSSDVSDVDASVQIER